MVPVLEFVHCYRLFGFLCYFRHAVLQRVTRYLSKTNGLTLLLFLKKIIPPIAPQYHRLTRPAVLRALASTVIFMIGAHRPSMNQNSN